MKIDNKPQSYIRRIFRKPEPPHRPALIKMQPLLDEDVCEITKVSIAPKQGEKIRVGEYIKRRIGVK